MSYFWVIETARATDDKVTTMKLSKSMRRALVALLGGQLIGTDSYGRGTTFSGPEGCNTSTMLALVRRGLVVARIRNGKESIPVGPFGRTTNGWKTIYWSSTTYSLTEKGEAAARTVKEG